MDLDLDLVFDLDLDLVLDCDLDLVLDFGFGFGFWIWILNLDLDLDIGFGFGGAATAGAGAAAAVAAGAEAAAVAGAAPTASFINGKWAVIVLPSSTRRASITPAFGDGTSIVVLSVSILATISSAWTDSPTYYFLIKITTKKKLENKF